MNCIHLDCTSAETVGKALKCEQYYHNATEIDAREYATSVMGYVSEHDCEFDD